MTIVKLGTELNRDVVLVSDRVINHININDVEAGNNKMMYAANAVDNLTPSKKTFKQKLLEYANNNFDTSDYTLFMANNDVKFILITDNLYCYLITVDYQGEFNHEEINITQVEFGGFRKMC